MAGKSQIIQGFVNCGDFGLYSKLVNLLLSAVWLRSFLPLFIFGFFLFVSWIYLVLHLKSFISFYSLSHKIMNYDMIVYSAAT